jgi:pimeloyl-ACP methyl ester carboxylesterase
MENLRAYGDPPFEIAVIHGGPGAGGEMAPVARELASDWGVLEPIQTATSVYGQVAELRELVEVYGDPPIVLIGFSWGAWLSFITAACHPDLVRKLILVGSGPFEASYASELHRTRMSRLSEVERSDFAAAIEGLKAPAVKDKDALLARLGVLASRADTYDPMPNVSGTLDTVDARGDVFREVWEQAAEMRKRGELLDLGWCVRCPVVAVHGDYDPHPAEGIERPLGAALDRFRLVLLKRCGHKPWIERKARDVFFDVLRKEISGESDEWA